MSLKPAKYTSAILISATEKWVAIARWLVHPWGLYYKKRYRFVRYGFHSKLVCLFALASGFVQASVFVQAGVFVQVRVH
jgi:hypothetical protein